MEKIGRKTEKGLVFPLGVQEASPEFVVGPQYSSSPLAPLGDFPLEQSRDDLLKHPFDQVKTIDGQLVEPGQALSYPYFSLIKDRLYRVTRDTQTLETKTQLLVPKSRREMLFHTANNNPMAGHLGPEKTLNRLMVRFYWLGIRADVRRWCALCHECQLVNPPAIPKAPLRSLPLIKVTFERIGMDLVGPLERSACGYRFVLVLVDYATRYPEAVPLRNISARSVAEALFKWQGPFEVTRRVGEVDYEVKQTDRGGALQVYHLNLLKPWREAVPVSLATVVPERAELGPEVPTKWNHTPVPCGDQLSLSQKAEVARLQMEFSNVFSPLPGCTDLIEHHIETPPSVVLRSRPYRLPEYKKRWFRMKSRPCSTWG
ncbi:hypothetical protein AOLI_G00065560 [Acnodon oligacanthus]